MYRSILVEFDHATKVATATLNRPQALNAITQSMLDDFVAFWKAVREDDEIHVAIVRGNLESKAFTSGADVNGGDDGTDRFVRNANVFLNRSVVEHLSPRMNYLYKPVICVVHGICAGAGLFFVNDCDIVLCSEDAQFFDPHLAIGLTSAQGPIGMSRRVNLGEVLRYTLLSNAERLSAATARDIGLVTEVVPKEALWARAAELAALIAAYEPAAVQGTLKAIWESLELGRKAALDRAQVYADAGRGASGGKRAQAAPRRPYTVR